MHSDCIWSPIVSNTHVRSNRSPAQRGRCVASRTWTLQTAEKERADGHETLNTGSAHAPCMN